jgi:hypothetical protein
MNVKNIIERAIDFGTSRSRKNFFSFSLKSILYIIPGVFLGSYTNILMKRIIKGNMLGDNILHYIILQTFIIISTLYVFLFLLTSYTNEFQASISGAFFIVLYFGIQTEYIGMIKQYINTNHLGFPENLIHTHIILP